MTEFNSTATTADIAAGNSLSTAVEKWFLKRGIDPETVIGCGISSRGEGLNTVVVFPFLENGVRVNNKYRGYNPDTQQFKKFWQDKAPKRTFFNADAIDTAIGYNKPLVITEGEMDALSCIEAGYTYVVSVPDGAPQEVSENPVDERNDLKFEYLWNNRDKLDKLDHIILASDGDEPGQALNHELSRRLGIERCSRVEYPAQEFNFGTEAEPLMRRCKDLNDVLIKLGPTELRKLIDNAKPYPVKGLHQLSDYPEPADPVTYSTQISGMDGNMMLETGRLMTITGVPGHGKSTFADCLLYNVAYWYGWHVCAGSFETAPNKGWLRQMTKRFRSELINKARPTEQMAHEWVQSRFSFVGQNPSGDDDLDLTIENIIEYAEISVYRYGTKVLLLDPWNEIEHCRRRDETETEYVNRAIKMLKKFARRFDVLVIIVAHPTKMTDKGNLKMPTLYDISGSANWFNKSDYGVIVWRDNVTDIGATQIKVSKTKEHDYMGKPGVVDLVLDPDSAKYFPNVPGAFGNLPLERSAA